MSKLTSRKFSILILLPVLIPILLLVGEIRCIYKAIHCDWDPIGKSEIIYTGAALTGLGCFIGYFNIEDTPPVRQEDKD